MNVVLLVIGVFAGLLLAAIQRHPRRLLGILPWTLTVVSLALALNPFLDRRLFLFLTSFSCGLIAVPGAVLIGGRPVKGTGRTRIPALAAILSLALAFCLCSLFWQTRMDGSGRYWHDGLLVAAILGALATWYFLLNHALELLVELVFWPNYRIRAAGPGLKDIPRRGPLIIIANHSAWMDPLWLGKVIPRRLYPMMGSRFYDLPILKFLMTYIVQAIRVEQGEFRREIPELREAVKVLKRGGCLVVFPEGHLRHREENVISRFGQGIWHILNECPETPVIACWIEGGWGSFFSYYRGRPTKNKRFDFWRRIQIGVGSPEVLPEDVLADHRNTRLFLMTKCLAAREHIGLPALDPPPALLENSPASP